LRWRMDGDRNGAAPLREKPSRGELSKKTKRHDEVQAGQGTPGKSRRKPH
jgi:hypothetical protein